MSCTNTCTCICTRGAQEFSVGVERSPQASPEQIPTASQQTRTGGLTLLATSCIGRDSNATEPIDARRRAPKTRFVFPEISLVPVSTTAKTEFSFRHTGFKPILCPSYCPLLHIALRPPHINPLQPTRRTGKAADSQPVIMRSCLLCPKKPLFFFTVARAVPTSSTWRGGIGIDDIYFL